MCLGLTGNRLVLGGWPTSPFRYFDANGLREGRYIGSRWPQMYKNDLN
jgi:hypothetical protein